MRRLSKSRYQTGLQCERALWLATHSPECADPIGESQQWVFDQGTEVGELAQGLFPGGTEVTQDYRETDSALQTTARLLAQETPVLYEPAFYFDGVLVRVDALVRTGNEWDLYEVKSSGSVKDQHITDAAVQTYVVEGCGLRVRHSSIVHLNTGYIYRGGDYDLARLFKIEDVTDRVRAYLPEVPSQIARFQEMLEGPEPIVAIGTRCRKPYTCSYSGSCHAFLPGEHPITDLPRLSEGVLRELLDAGITCIGDIPDSFTGLTRNQARTRDAVVRGEPAVDLDGLRRDLARLTWPVYHLDFETVGPALPLWVGTRPYQAVPFQYSIHVHHEDGSHEHREYLHTGPDDPRGPLADRMLTDLAGEGSIAHYTVYERRVIDGLASALPDRALALAALRSRLFDLEPVIRANTEHPDACGHSSIKYVLPAWCPDLSYADMNIGDGQTASVRYLKAIKGLVDVEQAERTYADLRDYCGLDTLAMVRLLDEMLEIAAR